MIAELDKFSEAEQGDKVDYKPHAKLHVGLGFAAPYRFAIETPGFQQIYFDLNDINSVNCDRFYYPDDSSNPEFRNNGIHTQENGRKLSNLDALFFSLNYEGNYLQLIHMLSASGIPYLATERDGNFPLLIAGGYAPTYNPNILLDCFDAVVVGDHKPTLYEIIENLKGDVKDRNVLMERMSKLSGVVTKTNENSRINKSTNNYILGPIKSIVTPFSYHSNILAMESTRGCFHNCNFCVLSKTQMPVRHQDSTQIIATAERMRQYTDSIRLVTPSDTLHPESSEIYKKLIKMGYKIQAGSMRADLIEESFGDDLSGLDIPSLNLAPEAGSEKLRYKINKTISDDSFMNAAKFAAEAGIKNLGLYFIIGFPNESNEDIQAIPQFIEKIRTSLDENGGRDICVNACINSHIKKPHTPYEFLPQQRLEEYERSIESITLGTRGINRFKMSTMESEDIALESILVRGKRQDLTTLAEFLKKMDFPEKITLQELENCFGDLNQYFEGKHIVPLWKNILL